MDIKKLLILYLLLQNSVIAQNKVLPDKTPMNFGSILQKLIADSPKDFENVMGEVKSFSENNEFKNYTTKISIPLADSCYIYDEITDDFDSYKVYEAAYGYYKTKKEGLKAIETLSKYIASDSRLMKMLDKEPLDDSEDGVVQMFYGKAELSSATMIIIYLKSVDAINPLTHNPVEYWSLTFTISEDFSD